MTSDFHQLRGRQAGAFTRVQANAHGISDEALAARLRAGRIQRIHGGVYADFAGPVRWETKMWAGWLACGPEAALTGETALRQYGIDGEWSDVIHLDIPHERRVVSRRGVIVTRCRDYERRLWGLREPPIVRLEVAVLTAASRRSRPNDALSIVLEVCRQWRTTPARLIAELAAMPRLPGRKLLRRVLDDAAAGAQSYLESIYLRQVEHRHGLPAGQRQARESSGDDLVYRDVRHDPFDVLVELDGRLGHEDTRATWRDMERDNAAALDGKLTLRYGYQLVGNPCRVAAQVAAVLRARGWNGQLRRCGPDCTALAHLPTTSAS